MRDGIRQNTGSQSSRPLDAFLFERIEVLKGPASCSMAKARSAARSSYVSKTAPRQFTGEAYASGGSWDTYRAGLGVGGPTGIDNVFFRFDASHNSSDGYVNGSEYQYDAFASDVRWEISDQHEPVAQRDAADRRHGELLRHTARLRRDHRPERRAGRAQAPAPRPTRSSIRALSRTPAG